MTNSIIMYGKDELIKKLKQTKQTNQVPASFSQSFLSLRESLYADTEITLVVNIFNDEKWVVRSVCTF